MKKRLIILLTMFLLITACSKEKVLGPGDHDFSFKHDGVKRTYEVHVPPSYDSQIRSCGAYSSRWWGNAGDMRTFTLMDRKSDESGFIAVYLQGTGENLVGKILGSWNGGGCCPTAMNNNVDDVGYVREVIQNLQTDFSIDEKRIYITGHSNGAIMSYRLACELSDQIAAIAPVSAQGVFESCPLQRTVPTMHFQGTADPCTGYDSKTSCGGCFANFLCEAAPALCQEKFLQVAM